MDMTSKAFINEPPRGQRGTALVLSLFLITVLTVLGTMVLNTSIVEIKMAQNQKISSQVFYAAEAGLERGLLLFIDDFETEGGTAWANSTYPGWTETVTETAVTGGTTFDPDIRSLDMYISSSDGNLKELTLSGGHTVNNLFLNFSGFTAERFRFHSHFTLWAAAQGIVLYQIIAFFNRYFISE